MAELTCSLLRIRIASSSSSEGPRESNNEEDICEEDPETERQRILARIRGDESNDGDMIFL